MGAGELVYQVLAAWAPIIQAVAVIYLCVRVARWIKP